MTPSLSLGSDQVQYLILQEFFPPSLSVLSESISESHPSMNSLWRPGSPGEKSHLQGGRCLTAVRPFLRNSRPLGALPFYPFRRGYPAKPKHRNSPRYLLLTTSTFLRVLFKAFGTFLYFKVCWIYVRFQGHYL